MMNKFRKKRYAFGILSVGLLLLANLALSQSLPEQPMPPRLVNDMAHLFSVQEQNALEQKLLAYNDSTSTQIAVVTVPDLNGMDKAEFAVALAHKWGIGQKDKDNGILILIKPKEPSSRGQTYIAVGYGVEHLVTDAASKRIITDEMLPYFKQGLMFAGVNAAVDRLFQLLSGQFTADEYANNGADAGLVIFIIIMIVIALLVFGRGNNGGSRHIATGSFPWWLLLGGNGGSGFGGNSGGFGGFGGGGFGGGGAGGSW